jgi:two-component system nitrate/nitrite sensor histidine kinase NarX
MFMLRKPERASGSLYHHLLFFRACLAVAVILFVLAIEFGEEEVPTLITPLPAVVADVLLYSAAGVALVCLLLAWVKGAVRERDEARARHDAAHQVSQEVASAQDMQALFDIALDLPNRLFAGAAASLVVQADRDADWDLAGTRSLDENQRASLEAFATGAGKRFICTRCAMLQATLHRDCPMLAALPHDAPTPAPSATICLPLTRSHAFNVVLSVYLAGAKTPPSGEALHTLESLGATLAVAMDWAHLRSRETQMLQQVEQAARARNTSNATLQRMLADIGDTYDADCGVVLLAPDEQRTLSGITIVCWPGEEPDLQLARAAEEALRSADTAVIVLSEETGQMVAIPLVAEHQYMGVMVLSGRFSLVSAQLASLGVVASMMAMIVRNNQLSAALESQAALEERYRLAREVHDSLGQYLGFLNFKVQQAERSLERQQPVAARVALHEARESIDDLYADLRLTIQDLRLPARDGPGFVKRLRDIVLSYANGSRLLVSFAAEGDPALAPEMEVQLLRIVREALTNIQRHAHAQRAWVRMAAGPENVMLEVKDDGIGFSEAELPQAATNFGLRIMRERAAAIGGNIRLQSAPGQGALLQVSVPLPPFEAQA